MSTTPKPTEASSKGPWPIATQRSLLAACHTVVDAWHADDRNFERELAQGTPPGLAAARAAIAQAEGGAE